MGTVYCWCNCCFNNLLTITIEIIELSLQSVSFLLLIISLIIIKWSNLLVYHICIYIGLIIITLIMIIFLIFIRFWRSKGLIKNIKKEQGIKFITTNFVLMILCIVICFIEEFSILYYFHKSNFPCQYYKPSNTDKQNDTDKICQENKNKNYNIKKIKNIEYIITYINFTYIEISLFIGLWLTYILKKRIDQELDGPPVHKNQPKKISEQYGKKVVVVHPGDIVILEGQNINGMSMKYNYNNVNNLDLSQNNPNQINAQLGVSQDFILQGKNI